jgi:hypothetical protein
MPQHIEVPEVDVVAEALKAATDAENAANAASAARSEAIKKLITQRAEIDATLKKLGWKAPRKPRTKKAPAPVPPDATEHHKIEMPVRNASGYAR